MGKGLPRSMSRGAPQRQEIIKQTILIKDASLTVTGGAVAAAGFGSAVVGDLPEGNILLLGAVAYLTFAGSGADANLADTWAGDFSIGSTATADEVLSGTEANVVASTPVGPAVAEISPRTRGIGEAQAVLDNTDGSLELNLNLITDDNAVTDSLTAVLTVNGELHLVYTVLGDD